MIVVAFVVVAVVVINLLSLLICSLCSICLSSGTFSFPSPPHPRQQTHTTVDCRCQAKGRNEGFIVVSFGPLKRLEPLARVTSPCCCCCCCLLLTSIFVDGLNRVKKRKRLRTVFSGQLCHWHLMRAFPLPNRYLLRTVSYHNLSHLHIIIMDWIFKGKKYTENSRTSVDYFLKNRILKENSEMRIELNIISIFHYINVEFILSSV